MNENEKILDTYFDFEVISNMNHELKNPLNSILSVPDLLMSGLYGELTEKQVTYIKIIKESGNKLLNLINEILEISQVQIRHTQFSSEPVEIFELVETVKYMLKEKMHKHSISFQLESPKDLVYFISDTKKIKYILISLINFLIKYSNFVDIINISFSRNDTGIRICIKNINGEVFESIQEKMFLPFQKVTINNVEVETGTGLFLSKMYIEKMGGKIHFHNSKEIEFNLKQNER